MNTMMAYRCSRLAIIISIVISFTRVSSQVTSWSMRKYSSYFPVFPDFSSGSLDALDSQNYDPRLQLETRGRYSHPECPLDKRFLDPRIIQKSRDEVTDCSSLPVSCYHSHFDKYRTIDGSCNNIHNPSWGMANICLRRILPHDYADELSYPRESCTHQPLPNPRHISNVFHQEFKVKNEPFTTQFLEWGQLLAHDLSLNDIYKTAASGNNIPIRCCDNGPVISEQCFSVAVPKDDPFYPQFGVNCLNIIRTVPCQLCSGGKRQHLNQNTAYHDLSLLYGSNEQEAKNLRSGVNGMLDVQFTPKAGPLLPPVPIEELCVASNPQKSCFKAGDVRSNQNILLLTVHTMLVRYHNFLCQELNKLNPHWDDETLYQEARRIFIAQVQMITYGQYLPNVLGEYMDKVGINILPDGKYTVYDSSLDASIADEYTTVAARYGHSLVPNKITEISPKTGAKKSIRFRDFYYTPFNFYKGQFDKIALGMTQDLKRKHDVFLSDDVRNWLYLRRYANETPQLDLAAMSIVRGRDHGIPGYTYYLSLFFNMTIHTFGDLKQVLPEKSVELLKEIYDSVHDVDIYVAGLAEYYVKGGFVGPTFATILSEQYKRIKFGDRFWFEHGNQPGSFNLDQLKEIKRTSLARIICESTTIKEIQEFVFFPPSATNPVVSCETIPRFNFYLWKD